MKENLIGRKFGRLTVVGDGKHEKWKHKWECLCECGNKTYVETSKLKSQHTQSCGCLKKERSSEASFVHGKYKSRIHKEWRGILHRCKNPSASHYENYGGRGIRVCDEWNGKNGFINFYNWSMKNGYSDVLTLDRINNNKGYSPENCRWVTHQENCWNRGKRIDCKTAHSGVSKKILESGNVKYRATIGVNYKTIHLGYFNTEKEAVEARIKAEEKYWNKKAGD